MSKQQQEQIKSNINLTLTFGDKSSEKKLIDMTTFVELGKQPEDLEQIMGKHKDQQKQNQQNTENDCFLMIRFFVQPGRQKQTCQYLQRGMDMQTDLSGQRLNPIQQILKRPKSAGKVDFEQKQGQIIVRYRLYDQYVVQNSSVRQSLLELLSDDHKPNLKCNFFIKGEQLSQIAERTSLLANYCEGSIKAEGVVGSKLFSFLQGMDFVDEADKQFLLYKMLKMGIKNIKLRFNMNPFNKLREMYLRIKNLAQPNLTNSQGEQIKKVREKPERSDSYLHKNLLKHKIEFKAYWKRLGFAKGQIDFTAEDHIQRLGNILWSLFDKF